MISSMTAEPTLNTASLMRNCAACGYENPNDVPICLNCATKFGPCCPSCGQAVPTGSKFCGQCGTRLPENGHSAPPAQPQPGPASQTLRSRLPTAQASKIRAASVKSAGERREVTVLFLDVTNFTAASHNLDSEDVYLFIDEAMSLLVQVVHKYEGTVDKFTGDGLMALFGAPVAHENDPERAVRAGLEMQNIIQPLRERVKKTYGFDFQVRIGINTGPVIAGKVGNDLHMEYTVIGDTVNLAARLESAAKPSTVLVSAETYQRTQPLFEFEVLPPVKVKGIPDPVQAFQPLGVLEKPGRIRGLAGLQVSMVGRADDLACLQRALQDVRQQQQRWIALVTGDAGLGKSRLIAEFRRSVAPDAADVYQGSCLAHAHSIPLWVVAELVRDILKISESDPADVQREALASHLGQLDLPGVEILPYLSYVLGLVHTDSELEARLRLLDADMLQRQTHTALRQFFIAEAKQKPTVLIFEDLHWLDPASRNFLEYLIQTSANVPLLLLLVSRQVERATVIRSLVAAAELEPERLVDLPLRALSETEGQLLVDQLISQSSPEARTLKRHIVRRAEGNPFYVEEIIRMLIDQEGLQHDPQTGAWHVTSQANQLFKAIPGTVKGLILARFDRLPEGLRQVLQKAAVLGSTFPVRLLEELDDTSAATLTGRLAELEARQFLLPEPFRSEPGYTFRHALLQETVYSTLLKRDRRVIHGRAAQAIERSPLWLPEEQTEALAHHYAESNTAAKAIPYLIGAAENAERRCANETAIKHYRRAQTLLPDLPTDDSDAFFRVRLGLGRSLKLVGEFTTADQILSETLQHVWGWGSAAESAILWPIMVECLRQLADLRQREGNYDQALNYLEAGLQILGQTAVRQEPKLWGFLVDRLAWVRFRQGHLDRASDLAHEAITNLNSDKPDDPTTLAKLYNTLGGVAWQQGRLDQAVSYVERSLQLYERVGYLWGTAIAYGNLGILHDVRGEWSKAANYYEQAYALHNIIGDLQNQAGNLDNLGTLHMAMGEHERAQEELEAGLSIRKRLGDAWGTAQSHVNLAHLALTQSRFEETACHAEAALSMADSIESSEIQVQARWILALVEAEKGQLQPGIQSAQQALDMARSFGLMEKETECLRVLGILHSYLGEYDGAEVLLQDSVELARKQNDPYRLGLALLELGRMHHNAARTGQAKPEAWTAKAVTALNQAADHFKALGAALDLQQTQAILNQMQMRA